MLKMKVTAQVAKRILGRIPHKTSQEGVKNHWRIGEERTANSPEHMLAVLLGDNGTG